MKKIFLAFFMLIFVGLTASGTQESFEVSDEHFITISLTSEQIDVALESIDFFVPKQIFKNILIGERFTPEAFTSTISIICNIENLQDYLEKLIKAFLNDLPVACEQALKVLQKPKHSQPIR